MKNKLLVGFLISFNIFVLGLFLFPKYGQFVTNYLVANVVGSSLCPSGDGKTFTDEILVQVNKETALPDTYIPKDLVNLSKEVKTTKLICLKKDALPFMKNMFSDAKKAGIDLAVTSGFRGKDVQTQIYNYLIGLNGEKAKNRIALPLHSEHHLGTTVDLSGKSIGYESANDKFIDTPEDAWLQENAYKYGFVLSYPKGKTDVTGYDFEPWHYRFVGLDVAKKIFDGKITLEEYLDSLASEA